jgi:type IV secretory pathway TraG/TraD family ATPase VirD4
MAKGYRTKIKLTYETNADETSKEVNNLSGGLDKVDNHKVSQAQKKQAIHTEKQQQEQRVKRMH